MCRSRAGWKPCRASGTSSAAWSCAASCDVAVYDDFAHHPTAIATTVAGLRRKIGSSGRILAVLEPRSNTMKPGVMKAQLPGSLSEVDRAYCYAAHLGAGTSRLASMGERAQVSDDLGQLVASVVREARAGDHTLVMSNGGFGGIHGKLLEALASWSRCSTGTDRASPAMASSGAGSRPGQTTGWALCP